MSNYAELIIKTEEGWRQHPYHCSEHYVTIGYGRKLSDTKYAPLPAMTANKEEELKFVREKISQIEGQLRSRFPVAWGKCNEQRQAILISLAYQVGFVGLIAFKKMWACLDRGDFEGASREMVNSKWYIQTRHRALRHSQQMRTGTMHVYYLTQGAIQ